MDNSLQLYKKIYKNNGGCPFTHKELKNRLDKQSNGCEICNTKFNAFNGNPIILGKAESAICDQCFESLNYIGWDVSNLAKAIVLVNRLSRNFDS